MAITPNTTLYLLKSPIELDNLNQLTFATKEAQTAYFSSLPKLVGERFTYQRKDGVIRYPEHIDSLYEYNYVMYQNSNYNNKWFYAFIDRMEYSSDNMTNIYISTDCYQTWMFDIDVKRSFVIREHTNNDTVGNNTEPEMLEKGPMMCTNCTPITYLRDSILGGDDSPDNAVIVVGSTRDLTQSTFPKVYGNQYNGIYSGCAYYAFMNTNSVDAVLLALNDGSDTAITDVISIFMAPKKLVCADRAFQEQYITHGVSVYVMQVFPSDPSYFRAHSNYTVPKPTSIFGYTPTNKKLLTGEFNCLNVTNYQGDTQNYRYEYFNGNNCEFAMRGAIKPQCSIQMFPKNYLRTASDDGYRAGSYAIQAPPIPLANWNSDQYTAWLAATTNSRTVRAISGVVSTVAGAAMMATGAGSLVGAGMLAGGVGSLANLSAEVADHSKDSMANHGSTTSADINYSTSMVFGAYQYCITEEYARKLDGVFNVIGYKTNRVKVPNVTGRRNWNYVQTQAVAILGTIPQEDLQKIKDMFNNGVTFWHNPATFLDYSQNNDII
jgi:hypothetical protein